MMLPVRRARLAALGAATIVLLTAGAGLLPRSPLGGTSWASTSAAPARTFSGRLRVVDETAWVGPGQPYTLRLAVETALPRADLELSVTVFSRLTSRSAFEQSLQNHFEGPEVTALGATPLDRMPADAGGVVTVQVPTDHLGDPGVDFSGCGAPCNGVYPVRVLLKETTTGATADELSTELVYSDVPPGSARLKVATILPVDASPALRPDGQRNLSNAASAGLGALVGAVGSNPRVPVSLLPTPETLQALTASPRTGDHTTLAGLQHAAATPEDEVLASSYVPVDVAALDDAGMDGELDAQLARGAQISASTLGARSDHSTWVATGSLDSGALDQLSSHSFDQLVVPDTDLAAVESKLTETSAFTLSSRSSHATLALAADSGLATHFADGPDPVLLAHQLLADLAVIYFDQPNSRGPRAVVAEAPRSWTPDAGFLQATLTGLASSPIIEPVTVAGAFHAFASASPNLRHLTSASSPGSSLPSAKIRATRGRLDAFESAVGAPGSFVTDVGDLLLVSESADMPAALRNRYVAGSNDALSSQLDLISLPVDRTVTLTARTARIPITIISSAPYAIHATLSVTSQQLSFPNGSTKGIVLDHRTNAEYFDVKSRSSGAFPLRVSLVSPAGGLLLVNGHFTVRSTAASGVAILLSAGAAIFLLAWWARSALTGRRERNRRLVPSEG